eukprot:scaffold115235_cov70-Cyclotella_meneghiniana.AAC.2
MDPTTAPVLGDLIQRFPSGPGHFGELLEFSANTKAMGYGLNSYSGLLRSDPPPGVQFLMLGWI